MNAHLCQSTVCLTLKGQLERQKNAVQQLASISINDFEFFYGVTADDPAVQQAYDSGAVKRFPPCFRCGKESCGRSDCNNVLIPVQVAVVISFRRIFEHCLAKDTQTVAICEDDFTLAAYAKRFFESKSYHELMHESGMFSSTPTLIRLGAPQCPDHFFDEKGFGGEVLVSEEARVSNYLFLCNLAFAKLAAERLQTIDHTADVLIHVALQEQANCTTLIPQVACDKSWALGTADSLIHPKSKHLEYLKSTVGESSEQYRQARRRLQAHKKHIKVIEHAFIGIMTCDFQRLIEACREMGLEIGFDVPMRDGFASWKYGHKLTAASIYNDTLNDPFFVHVRNYYLVVPDPLECIRKLASRIAENDGSLVELLSFIEDRINPNSTDRLSEIEKAVGLFVYWYRHARETKDVTIVHEQNLGESLSWALVGTGTVDTLGPELGESRFQIILKDLRQELAADFVSELYALGYSFS